MCRVSVQHRILAIITVTFASKLSAPLVRNSIDTLRSVGKNPVLFRFSSVSSSELYSWASDTPITSLVAKNKCLTIPDGVLKCRFSYSVLREGLNLNAVLVVPSWPENVLTDLNRFLGSFHHVPALVILPAGNENSGKPVSCLFIWISNITIDVPDDNCFYTGGRAKRQQLLEDTLQVQDRSLYLKNMALIVFSHRYVSLERAIYTHHPEVVAYLKALAVLNVTPIFTEGLRHSDINIEPYILDEVMLHDYDIGGVYTCFGHGFFSSRERSHFFNIISWSSLTILLAAEILVGAIITVSFCLTRSVLSHRCSRISELLLFLVASSLGRSPVPFGVGGISFGVFILIWLYGNIVIGTYVQSHITSEYSVPSYLPAVETVEDLHAQVSSGVVLPCVDISKKGSRFLLGNHHTSALETTMRIMMRNWKSCASNAEGCCRRAQAKTHVYIAPVDFARRMAAYEWDLRPGKDVLFTTCTVALARRDFRYVRQHRRLVLGLAEAGLTIHEEQRRTLNHMKDSATMVTLSFSLQFEVLIYGCTGSFLIFLCELVLYKVMQLKRLRNEHL